MDDMKWNPISTAPKNSKEIILYDGEDIVIAFWNKWVREEDGKDRGAWCAKYDSDMDWGGNEPTHWMPLPKPPGP